MAMSNNLSASPVPTYFIYRDVPEGQLYDPTASLAFFPPKDSDELFDALRAKYPHLKSHSERMRDATIEFLLEEREAEALSANVSPAVPSLYDSMADTSPWQQSWPSVSMTTLSSPEMTNFPTPAFSNSPKPQIPHMVRSQSSAATLSDSQTPALDSMTSVFSLSTTEQPKQRVRRKMTDLEKIEYRKRRIVKACDTCSKRKRKCVHNKPEMEDLKKSSNDKTTHKVTKPRTAKQPQAAEVSFSFDHHATNPSNAFAADGFAGGYEDFTLMFDEPTFDFGLDDLMSFDPQNYNTKPDNFRQCVQNFSASPGRPHSTLDASHDWNVLDTNTTASFSNSSQGFDPADNVNDLLIPHSSQRTNDHEGRRRCDLTHSQAESSLTSGARMASAGQLDAHGILVAANASSSNASGGNASGVNASSINASDRNASGGNANSSNASSNSGDLGVFTRTTNVHEPNNSLQVDSDRGGWQGEGAPNIARGGQSELSPLISGDQALADTALRRSRRSAVGVSRSAAGTSPQSNLRRHRTRSDGVYDPALQSELSMTSATSSSTGSNTEHTATLQGWPTDLGGTPVSPQLSPRGGRVYTRLHEDDPVMPIPAPSPRHSPTQGATAPLSSQLLSSIPRRNSPTVSTTTRTSNSELSQHTRAQSALLARPSPFDRVDGTHAHSTELFRLKHRIPASLDSSTPATGFVPSAANLSAQANGGAYPRLSSIATTSTRSATGLATQQQTTQSSQSTLCNTDKSKATEASGARMLFTESDTRRYRDHHGRTVSQEGAATASIRSVAYDLARVALAIFALGVMLMSTSIFAHTSFLLLAIVAPVFVALDDWSASSPSPLSRAHRALTLKREKQQASLARFSLHRPLGCV